jgi:hypothetical protein
MDATLSNIVGPTMLDHCPALLDQQCWTIVGQHVQTDATISQQLLAVQLVQNSVRK